MILTPDFCLPRIWRTKECCTCATLHQLWVQKDLQSVFRYSLHFICRALKMYKVWVLFKICTHSKFSQVNVALALEWSLQWSLLLFFGKVDDSLVLFRACPDSKTPSKCKCLSSTNKVDRKLSQPPLYPSLCILAPFTDLDFRQWLPAFALYPVIM